MKELYLLLEEEELAPQQQADNKTCAGDAWTPNTVSGVGRISPHWASPSGSGVIPNPGGTPRPSPRGWRRAGSGYKGGNPRSPPRSPAAQRVHQDTGGHEGDPEGAVHGAAGGAARRRRAAAAVHQGQGRLGDGACRAQVPHRPGGSRGRGDAGLGGGCLRRVPNPGCCWGGLGGRMARQESQ